MRDQKEGEEEEEEDYSGTENKDGSTLSFSTTVRFCVIKQRTTKISSRSIKMIRYTIRSSEVSLEAVSVFLMTIHSRGQILYGSFRAKLPITHY